MQSAFGLSVRNSWDFPIPFLGLQKQFKNI